MNILPDILVWNHIYATVIFTLNIKSLSLLLDIPLSNISMFALDAEHEYQCLNMHLVSQH